MRRWGVWSTLGLGNAEMSSSAAGLLASPFPTMALRNNWFSYVWYVSAIVIALRRSICTSALCRPRSRLKVSNTYQSP